MWGLSYIISTYPLYAHGSGNQTKMVGSVFRVPGFEDVDVEVKKHGF